MNPRASERIRQDASNDRLNTPGKDVMCKPAARNRPRWMAIAVPALAVAVLAMLATLPASATSIYVVSVGIRDIQVILDGRNVRTLRLGEVSPEGVKLTDIDNGAALLEVNGRAVTLRPGQSIASRTVLLADSQGHFVTDALINGVPVRALVDTGATYVSLSAADALRMGVDYQQGRRTESQTVNGPIQAYVVNLTLVQVGDIAFANVPGLVVEDIPGRQIPALIGMSFLRYVEMRQTGNTMVLQQADR